MHIRERLIKDKQTLASLDRKGKINYIWDYYKIPVFAAVIVLAVAVYSIISSFTRKEDIMTVVLVNSASEAIECDDTVFIRQLEKAGVRTEGREVEVIGYLKIGEESYENQQDLMVLNAMFTLGDMDIFIAEKKTFDLFIDKEAYADLSSLLDEKLLQKYAGDLYKYENEAGDEVILGIIIHNGSPVHKAGYYNGDVIISIPSKSRNTENAIAFFNQILSD